MKKFLILCVLFTDTAQQAMAEPKSKVIPPDGFSEIEKNHLRNLFCQQMYEIQPREGLELVFLTELGKKNIHTVEAEFLDNRGKKEKRQVPVDMGSGVCKNGIYNPQIAKNKKLEKEISPYPKM